MKDMVRIIFGLMLFMMCVTANEKLFAQKKSLDHFTVDNWPVIKNPTISNDGRYVAYLKKSGKEGIQLIVQDTSGKWKKEIAQVAGDYQFTADSRRLIYTLPNDSLGLLELGTSTIKYATGVDGYPAPETGNDRWLAFKLKGDQHALVVIDLQQNTETKYPGIGEFQFSPGGNVIIMQTTATKDTPARVYWLDLANGKKTGIGSGYMARRIVFDKTEQKLAYISIVAANGGFAQNLCYYQPGMDTAKVLVNNTTPGMEGMAVTAGSMDVKFSKKGDKIFFAIVEHTNSARTSNSQPTKSVQINSYRDESAAFKKEREALLAVVHLGASPKVIKLQENSDKGIFHFGGGQDDDYLVFENKTMADRVESRWNVNARPDIYLVSTADGSRKSVKKQLATYGNDDLVFSPDGKYLVWYDKLAKNWFSLNVTNRASVEITAGIKSHLDASYDFPELPPAEGIMGWSGDNRFAFIYDRYDIWRVDLEGKIQPFNITHSYGARNNIRFRLMESGEEKARIFHDSDTLLLTALDQNTKDNGFFKLSMKNNGALKKLLMAPKIFGIPLADKNSTFDFSGQDNSFLPGPLKAKNSDTYLLACMSASDYPNLNITNDLVHFKQITNLSPQKKYNWYNTALLHWKRFDGEKGEGILYKPENFDSKKKYPIIFYYYERSADALNLFLNPELSTACINIPWLVSNGYLVFVPDIDYKIGIPGEGAYNAIVSAATMLAKEPWVDAHKMGLQGHSFGGFETNYIVSHSHLFAAAASGAGLSDLVSGYSGDGHRSQVFYENEQVRMGATLWQRPDLYIKNSPIFNADKVTTPLFIMHNKDDGSVPWGQGEEWYSDLVRLGKKVWMVTYAGEGHTIDDPAHELDYSIRLGQFFDYYLKNSLPPKWMTGNSGNSQKDDDLQLDQSGERP